jgi:hypothetical protein
VVDTGVRKAVEEAEGRSWDPEDQGRTLEQRALAEYIASY